MRILISLLMLVSVSLCGFNVMAEESALPVWKSQGIGCIDAETANAFFNQTDVLDHTHDVAIPVQDQYERDTEYGVGFDLEYILNDTHSIVLENKVDFNSKTDGEFERSHYVVWKMTIGNK